MFYSILIWTLVWCNSSWVFVWESFNHAPCVAMSATLNTLMTTPTVIDTFGWSSSYSNPTINVRDKQAEDSLQYSFGLMLEENKFENMREPELYRMEHEDTEEQRGWCLFLLLTLLLRNHQHWGNTGMSTLKYMIW